MLQGFQAILVTIIRVSSRKRPPLNLERFIDNTFQRPSLSSSFQKYRGKKIKAREVALKSKKYRKNASERIKRHEKIFTYREKFKK